MNCVPIVIFLFVFMKYVNNVILNHVLFYYYFIINYLLLYFNKVLLNHIFLLYHKLCIRFNILWIINVILNHQMYCYLLKLILIIIHCF